MDELFELLLKHGLKPLTLVPEWASLEKKLNRSELTAVVMLHHHGEMTTSELAASLGVPLSTMTSLSKRLTDKKLFWRFQSEQDQRIILLRVTEEGAALAAAAREMLNKTLVRVGEALTAEELQQFVRLALKAAKALQGGEGSGKETEKPVLRRIEIGE
ncbi:MAG: transcriptional regulator [Paenibacillaceae bacterium]|jgi:DNA-binding MarR family transcriptional regulator|nr:transcriptional regulator [Paenibacillaceae bacterium]